jgi:hypothetical protein
MKNGRQDLGERAHRGIYPAVVDAAMAWVEWSDTFTRASRMPNEAQMIAAASRTQSSRESSRVVMDPTVQCGGVTVANGRPLSVQLPKGKRETLEECAARRLGCTPATAHKMRYELPRKLAEFILAAVECGDLDAAAALIAPPEAAIAGLEVLPIDEAMYRCRLTDAHEDTAEAEFERHRSRETARALILKSAADCIAIERRNAALMVEFDL